MLSDDAWLGGLSPKEDLDIPKKHRKFVDARFKVLDHLAIKSSKKIKKQLRKALAKGGFYPILEE